MTKTRDFPVRAIATVTTGFVIEETFSGTRQVLDWVIGYDLYTHEIPSVADLARERIFAQHPDMPHRSVMRRMLADLGKAGAVAAMRAELAQHFPQTLPLRKGTSVRTMGPEHTLPAGVETIFIRVGGD